ncbi:MULTISPECIES: hypothetical protein [unclassified Sphingomonas]|uniref:hypothetical protein n=1 Tax=unclassified Sphingomonas TaxID=196159 RepID=UPI0012E265E1|nr:MULTISPECIES: hypothetical protein [unclassified Sphingomonas]
MIATIDLASIGDLSAEVDADRSIGPALLVRRRAALTGEDRLRVRLDVIETDAGSRFHTGCRTLGLNPLMSALACNGAASMGRMRSARCRPAGSGAGNY